MRYPNLTPQTVPSRRLFINVLYCEEEGFQVKHFVIDWADLTLKN